MERTLSSAEQELSKFELVPTTLMTSPPHPTAAAPFRLFRNNYSIL
jgi:hypothetical protein